MLKLNTLFGGLMLALMIGLVGLPAEARKKKAAPPIELTAQGQALEARYAELMAELQKELADDLPRINERAQSNYLSAIAQEKQAITLLETAQAELGKINGAKGLIGHAKNHWIPKADRGIKAAQKKLDAATTQAERDAAQAELTKWQENRQAGLDALKERTENYERLAANAPALKLEVENAKRDRERAEKDIQRALASLRLKSFLESDRHDEQLARYAMLHHATPKRLAGFAQQSARHAQLIDQLLADGPLLVDMAVADGAKDGNYGRAMEIYTTIQANHPKAKEDGVLQRLALAIALEHATPRAQRNEKARTDAPQFVDPVARYAHYENAYLADDLDPYFKIQSAWDLRFVVNGEEPDHVLTWGREMLRNYRPDMITTKDDRWRYVSLVRTCVRYGSEENKNDKDELHFFQNILMNGGICGRRAFFGRFILRSFGVPTIARPQRGHAALARWTPDGWVVCLGAGWGSGWTKTQYKDDLDFLAVTKARAAGDGFMPIKRAMWAGNVAGEQPVYGLNDKKAKPGLWYSVALQTQRKIADSVKTLDAVGTELGEANESKVKYPFDAAEVTDEDREIRVDRNGVISIPAAATTKPTKSTGKILFTDSVLGGKQLHYSRNGRDQDFVYTFDAPKAGTYRLALHVNTPAWKQMVNVVANGNKPVALELPHTIGLWQDTQPVMIELKQGKNTLTFTRKGVSQDVAPKGFSIKSMTLTPDAGNRQ
ncbi:MAG: hypothetical protein ACPGYV_09005 [Phycisphaeraceae bacterium]